MIRQGKIIDLVEEKMLYFMKPFGLKVEYKEISDEYRQQTKLYREKLIEKLASFDDTIGEKFVAGEEVLKKDMTEAIKVGTQKRLFMPLLVGSALKNKGVQMVLDSVLANVPSPDCRENFGLILNE